MRRKTLLFFFLLSVLTSRSQNPATIFSIPNRNVVLACGTACTTITATVPHIKQTDDYIVTPMAYLPYAYTTASGVDVATLIAGSLFDDRWTSKVPITFPFCFYGITYPTLVIGTNSAITFDSTQASTYSGYVISNTTGAIPNSAYYGPEIFGPYHDIDIDNPGPNKRIEYRIEGVAPNRRFIVSYSAVPYFSVSCTTSFATHQMVLYESTGVIEVYIQDKPSCTAWNSGLSILGVQNGAENKAVAAPGKNATVWGSTGMNEAYRFTPSGGVPKFKKAELLVNGAVVGTGDTTSGNPGLLNLNFANVCPGSDSTAYILRVTYGTCNNTAQDVSFQDTVFIKRTKATIALSALNASCGTGGTITATATGGTGFQYSLNGGAPQAGNTFSNLNAGIYTVSAQSGTCVSNAQTTITEQYPEG